MFSEQSYGAGLNATNRIYLHYFVRPPDGVT